MPSISHSLPLPDIKHVPKSLPDIKQVPKLWPSLCARAASDALLFMHLVPQKGALSLPCTCSLFPWVGFGASFWTFPRPVLWSCKLATAWPKAFSYRIRTPRFRPRDGSVFGAFLVRFGAPCRVFHRFEGFALEPRFWCLSRPVLCSCGLSPWPCQSIAC